MGSDQDTAAHIFKRKYSDQKVANIVERDHPRFARLKRKGGFNGTEVAYHILTGNPQGISGRFEDAQSGAESSKGKQPKATRRPKFAVIQVDAEAQAASEGDDGAFYNLLTRETTGKFMAMGQNFAFDAYRDGTGRRGRRASISGNTIALEEPTDINNFEEGMTLIADNNDTGASPKTGSAKVVSIDQAGTVTLDSAASISGFADNDYLFRKGDPGTCMDGLAVCTPLVAPVYGVDSFRGIDRGSHVGRLAGSRVPDDGTSVEDKMGLGAIYCQMIGKQHVPTEGYVNPLRFWEVVRRQNSKVQFGNPKAEGYRATYGFQYIEIATPAGVMTLYSDPDCPARLGYGTNPTNEYIHHLKGLPHMAMQGPSSYLIQATAAGIEARAYSWCNYIQEDPAAFFVAEF